MQRKERQGNLDVPGAALKLVRNGFARKKHSVEEGLAQKVQARCTLHCRKIVRMAPPIEIWSQPIGQFLVRWEVLDLYFLKHIKSLKLWSKMYAVVLRGLDRGSGNFAARLSTRHSSICIRWGSPKPRTASGLVCALHNRDKTPEGFEQVCIIVLFQCSTFFDAYFRSLFFSIFTVHLDCAWCTSSTWRSASAPHQLLSLSFYPPLPCYKKCSNKGGVKTQGWRRKKTPKIRLRLLLNTATLEFPPSLVTESAVTRG